MARRVRELGGGIEKTSIGSSTETYESYFEQHDSSQRKANYTDVVNKYYDLATSFYEWGWGESFHFAHRLKGETLKESISRHEHLLALKLGLKPGDKVLDVGCGIGGPARGISAFSGASVVGLNNNDFQIKRAQQITASSQQYSRCSYVKADFMKLPAADGEFDAVYEIEATCHAPDIRGVYAEIFRVLKKGGHFASYEWALTDKYREDNSARRASPPALAPVLFQLSVGPGLAARLTLILPPPRHPAHGAAPLQKHKEARQAILKGNGLPDLRRTAECLQALKDVGFEVVEECDLSKDSEVPWYLPIDAKRSLLTLEGFRTTWLGRGFTRVLVWVLETLGAAPKGSVSVSQFLEKGADALVEGGREGIFTPMYFTLARKPL